MLLCPVLSKPLYAGYKEGVEAYMRGDYNTAFRELKASAEKGDAGAQNALGGMYTKGNGVTKNSKEAVKWYRKAAEQGYALAQYNLGFMYRTGQGVTRDYKEAVKWYKKAAEQGIAFAQFSLGTMYHNGKGVTRDYVLSYKWFNRSASGGDETARKALDSLEKVMTPEQIAEAQKISREFKKK